MTALDIALAAIRSDDRRPARGSVVARVGLTTRLERMIARVAPKVAPTPTPAIVHGVAPGGPKATAVEFPWGVTELTFPEGSQLFRPPSASWAIVRTPSGDLHEISATTKTGRRIADPDQVAFLRTAVEGSHRDYRMDRDTEVRF